MSTANSTTRPDWVSDEMFPFESKFFTTPTGKKMHYVDEGNGDPIVFVHGNPSWSFEFRHMIAGLKSDHRCIAMDHVGFGLSENESDREKLHPKQHAINFAALLDSLDLQNVTLFLTDWGGPIALDYARSNPERIGRIVVANSWSWPVSGDFHFISFSFMMSSWLGQYLIRSFNIFVERVMPMAMGNKEILTDEVMDHYRKAQASGERDANAALPGHIVGATDWLREIWKERATFTGKPLYVFWGLKDIAFRKQELEVWTQEFVDHRVERFEDCGHFLSEEAPERMIERIRDFIAAGSKNADAVA